MLLVRLVVSLGIVFVLLYLPAAAIVIKFLRRSQSALLGEMSHGVCLTFDDGPDPGYAHRKFSKSLKSKRFMQHSLFLERMRKSILI